MESFRPSTTFEKKSSSPLQWFHPWKRHKEGVSLNRHTSDAEQLIESIKKYDFAQQMSLYFLDLNWLKNFVLVILNDFVYFWIENCLIFFFLWWTGGDKEITRGVFSKKSLDFFHKNRNFNPQRVEIITKLFLSLPCQSLKNCPLLVWTESHSLFEQVSKNIVQIKGKSKRTCLEGEGDV